MEAHPGDTPTTKATNNPCNMTDTAARDTVKWLEEVEEKLRVAKETSRVFARSAKRRKTSIGHSINDHNGIDGREANSATATVTPNGARARQTARRTRLVRRQQGQYDD